MLENNVKEIISGLLEETIVEYQIKTTKRYFKSDFEYKATFAITANEIPLQTIDNLSKYIKEGNDLFSLNKTQLLDEEQKEVLYITANIQTKID